VRYLISYKTGENIPVGGMITTGLYDKWMPEGFVECDGSLLHCNIYPLLYQIIRHTHNKNSDPESYFRLPDYRNIRHDMEPMAGIDMESDGDVYCWLSRIGV